MRNITLGEARSLIPAELRLELAKDINNLMGDNVRIILNRESLTSIIECEVARALISIEHINRTVDDSYKPYGWMK